jgi:hypothetical protein
MEGFHTLRKKKMNKLNYKRTMESLTSINIDEQKDILIEIISFALFMNIIENEDFQLFQAILLEWENLSVFSIDELKEMFLDICLDQEEEVMFKIFRLGFDCSSEYKEFIAALKR